MQDGVCRLVPSEGLFGEMLVALSKALHFSQTGVQCHGRVIGVLSHVEVRSPPKLLLYHQGLLQQLGGTGEQGFGTDSVQTSVTLEATAAHVPAILPPNPNKLLGNPKADPVTHQASQKGIWAALPYH